MPSSAKSCLYSVFFDLQEAAPRVWRHYIVQKLFEFGLRGNLPFLLHSFLNNRSRMVAIQNVTSSPLTVENDVPQGEVFSVPLFLIAINDISKCVKFPLTQRLFADNYSISLRSSNPDRAHRLLQEVLNIITAWSNSNGFRFSSKKPTWLSSKKGVSLPALNPCFFKISKFHSVTQLNSLACTLIKTYLGQSHQNSDGEMHAIHQHPENYITPL